jgi:CheY-like chemotaxis protein
VAARGVSHLSDFRQKEGHPTLIVVEPNPDEFLLLKRALWKSGATARVWWAHDAGEALMVLSQIEAPTIRVCIVADFHLPGLAGFELLERVKSRTGGGRVTFAFLTGYFDRKDEVRAYACGVDAFFLKPTQPEGWIELARSIQRLTVTPMVSGSEQRSRR